MKPLVVMPTYNESLNMEKIIRMILSDIETPSPVSILVVDDNSPDGTADVVRKLMETEFGGFLFLLRRDRKSGLGTAYIDGFNWGLSNGYGLFIEMDADFSHHPRYLAEMLSVAETYDFIIGSRYVEGGGVKGWGLGRKFISRFGSLYAKTILNLPIRDLTGGFNIWKKAVLEKIDLNTVRSEGYAFQIELKFRACNHAFHFFEHPIIFKDRLLGKSKISKKVVLEAIYRVWQLRFGNMGR